MPIAKGTKPTAVRRGVAAVPATKSLSSGRRSEAPGPRDAKAEGDVLPAVGTAQRTGTSSLSTAKSVPGGDPHAPLRKKGAAGLKGSTGTSERAGMRPSSRKSVAPPRDGRRAGGSGDTARVSVPPLAPPAPAKREAKGGSVALKCSANDADLSHVARKEESSQPLSRCSTMVEELDATYGSIGQQPSSSAGRGAEARPETVNHSMPLDTCENSHTKRDSGAVVLPPAVSTGQMWIRPGSKGIGSSVRNGGKVPSASARGLDDEEDGEDDDDEEEDDDGEEDECDEEDEDEEDEEDEGEEEEEDEEDDEDDDEEEEEDVDECGATQKGVRGAKREELKWMKRQKITVKVSREGDRNVKIIFISFATRFSSFRSNVKRRFGYSEVGDFDIYCINAAGDHVDIDVSKDFKNLVTQFLKRLRATGESDDGKARTMPQSASAATGEDNSASTGAPSSRRFVAREARTGSASLRRSPLAANEFQTSVEDGDRSSTTVLRLYVRDSHRARQQEEQRRLLGAQLGLPDARRPAAPLLSAGEVPVMSEKPDSQGGVSSKRPSTSPSTDFLTSTANTISTQLNRTSSTLNRTLLVSEDSELQWSKVGLLGKGSFGCVYEGISSDGKIFAVKVQDIPFAEDTEELLGVQREINLMRSLKHTNIVAYYGCQTKVQESGARCLEIFLEHCHGGSLTQLRRKFERANERFSISLVRTYTKQILQGLSYLHKMKVVHRDIKGDNVLISSQGEAKLADFGCSKRIGTAAMQGCGGEGAGGQTFVGTPFFMAPEVLSGNGDYGPPADVWSTGCLVLELLGRTPWIFPPNANAFQVMYQISKSASMPTGVPKKCPTTLYDFFLRCFERDVPKRATAVELLEHEWIKCPEAQLEEVPPDN